MKYKNSQYDSLLMIAPKIFTGLFRFSGAGSLRACFPACLKRQGLHRLATAIGDWGGSFYGNLMSAVFAFITLLHTNSSFICNF
jgi:hypothetical protein